MGSSRWQGAARGGRGRPQGERRRRPTPRSAGILEVEHGVGNEEVDAGCEALEVVTTTVGPVGHLRIGTAKEGCRRDVVIHDDTPGLSRLDL